MLLKDFAKWVAVAYLIACPIGYYVMHKWLQDFAYRTGIHWWIYAIVAVVVGFVAIATINIQAVKVASKNPVESLMYE